MRRLISPFRRSRGLDGVDLDPVNSTPKGPGPGLPALRLPDETYRHLLAWDDVSVEGGNWQV